MELIKKNIHMDRVKAQAVSQITLEEDINIPDQKPDVSSLCFDRATVTVDEVCALRCCTIPRRRAAAW